MTLIDLMQLLRKKWYILVAFPLVFGLVTAAYCWGVMSDDYTSSVSLYILSKNDDDSQVTASEITSSQQLANDIAVLVKTNKVVDATAKHVGIDNLDEYTIDVNSATTNRVITLSVTGKRPEAVAQIADELATQITSVALDVMDLNAVNVVDEAQVPQQPSGPNRLMYTAVAVLAGLFVAVALVIVLDLMDTTVKSSDELERAFGIPNLGNMPTVKKTR